MTQVAAIPSVPATPPLAAGRALRTPETVRLNPFQLLMRRWSALHPYNAGQVMEVTGEADRERWKGAIEAVLGEMGLGAPRFSDKDWLVRFEPVADIAAGEGGSGASLEVLNQNLEAFFNDELNRPFAAGDLPIRFCILPGPRGAAGSKAAERPGQTHYLAAVYDHWIADSRAMRELMARLFAAYQDPLAAGRRYAALTLQAPPFNALFRQHVGRLTRLRAIRESMKNVWRHRHGFRVNIADPTDFTSRFQFTRLRPGLIDAVCRFAKSRQTSVNDVFLAALGQTMGASTAAERLNRYKKPFHFRRRQVGLGTIVDIRDAASQTLDDVFNLYLSSYTVLLNAPEARPLGDLAHDIAGDTRRIKNSHDTVRGFWALAMARFWWDLYPSARYRSQLLHKTVPVTAGISNVNMTNSWADQRNARDADLPRVLDYLRISPTGPLLPLVFTLTTIGDRLTLCVTYRTTAFGDGEAAALADDFRRRLESL